MKEYGLEKRGEIWYTPKEYKVETDVINLLKNSKRNIEIKEEDLEDEEWKRLDPGQKEALIMVMKNDIGIITGGAGTGKTRTTTTLIRMMEKWGINYKVLTFTGKAASRIKEEYKKNNKDDEEAKKKL